MRKIVVFIVLFLCLSCEQEGREENLIKAEKGAIDVVINVYHNVSKGLDEMKSYPISRMNFSGETIVELIPNMDVPEIIGKVYVIKDTLAYDVSDSDLNSLILTDLLKSGKGIPVTQKRAGAIFSNDVIPNLLYKKDLNDTILFHRHYKRFEINGKENYLLFYVHPTDTVLPYQVYHRMYNGRIERIDSYDKKKDVFISFQLFFRKEWDKEAQDVFEFNDFVEKKRVHQ